MSEKALNIVEAAGDVFSRYGVRKTTMADIATHAGISRQTLYASFPNKEQILAATIRHAYSKTIQSIKDEWSGLDDVGAKLDSYFEHAVLYYFRTLKEMPDSDDLLTGFNETGMAELKCMEAEKVAMLVDLFSTHEKALKSNGQTAADLANFVQTSAAHFKFCAADEEHLKRLLATLKSSTLALLTA